MSLAVLYSRALLGVKAQSVRVEVHLANGLPGFTLVGLPETEVKESRDRVRAAIQTAGYEFPQRRITVNLAPADLPKESGHYDLPIALGILAASGQIPHQPLGHFEFAGELSLSGELLAVRGALAFAAALVQENSARSLILSTPSSAEAALVNGIAVYAAPSLLAVCTHLYALAPTASSPTGGRSAALLPLATPPAHAQPANHPDLRDIKGQTQAKRALEIAAAGGHSLLLIGPPGTGKSMLAARLPSLLPPLDETAALESAALLSLSGKFRPAQFRQRVFRHPHHTASGVALVGGSSNPRPGEISLAHHGVLFLDELPEFDRKVLEVLREPLESGHITISRAARQTDFPAQFQLVAAMNPCPCGYLGQARCRCTPDQITRYQGKISGPLLDRIDMVCEVPALPETDLLAAAQGETSASVAERVAAALALQQARQGKSNARLSNSELESVSALDSTSTQFLQQAIQKLKLSARAYHRVLKLARTIADLQNTADLNLPHVAEALQYRRGLSVNDF